MNSFKSSVIYSLIILFFAICIVAIILPLIPIVNHFHDKNILEAPYYYAGIVAGILSIFSFLGVLMTLYNANVQNERNEENWREEKFKTTFFNMLSLQQEIVNGLMIEMDYVDGEANSSREAQRVKSIISGRGVFMTLFLKYNFSVANLAYKIHEDSKIETTFSVCSKNEAHIEFDYGTGMKEVLKCFGLEGYENSKELSLFDHYFRHLYTILRYIDDGDFLDAEADSIKKRYEYARILRSTLSDYELVWIFYNGLSIFGCEKFKPLIEKYSLLKNLRVELLGYSNELSTYRSEKYNENLDKDIYPKDDYEYFSTKDPKDKSKYYLSAYYNNFMTGGEKSELDNALNKFGK